MNRRVCLTIFLGFCATVKADSQKPRKFAFKIKTKDGNIVSNVLIEAHDVDAAKFKLNKRYPGCTVLRVNVK